MNAPPARHGRIVAGLVATLCVCWPVAVAADAAVCPGAAGITVEAESTALTERACDAAASALEMLQPCGLNVPPGLQISVVDALETPHTACLADYDCDLNRIRVLSPAALEPLAETGSAFSIIPQDVLFDSLVAHEMAHALLEEASAPEELPMLSHEFIAYSTQIASMPDIHRERFLATDAASVDGPTETLVNPFILMMAPDLFAAAAYRQLSPEKDLCSWVDRLLTGEEVFIEMLEF